MQKPPFMQHFVQLHGIHDTRVRQAHVFQVWFSFFWWFFGEVKHFVHLIRWNLTAVICRLGQELTTGLEWHNCTTFRFRNWILFVVWFCFHQLVPHWSPISCFLPSPGRLAPSRAEIFVGFRCVRLVQALPSSPPSVGFGPCPSTLRFFFSLAFSGFARSGLGVLVCVFSFPLLLRSPSSRSG